jgi:hypothetical protein
VVLCAVGVEVARVRERGHLRHPGRLERALEQRVEVEGGEPLVLLDVLHAALEVAQARLDLAGQQSLDKVLQRSTSIIHEQSTRKNTQGQQEHERKVPCSRR